jgi:zinc/manganese transport system ATP-binding protein
MYAFEFDDLTLAYQRHPALHHLSARIRRGSLTAVVGPNGCGKSTLLKAIMGELAPVEGRLLRHRLTTADIAYLPQLGSIDRDFPLNAGDFLASGMWQQSGAFAGLPVGSTEAIGQALAKVGLNDFERRQIGKLSGGQMQRLLFARLLLQDKPVVLLDEPFNAIDTRTAADLMMVVTQWHGEARTVLVVTHDLDNVRAHFPETLLLARELVAHGKTTQVLTAANMFKARQMCEAFDEAAEPCHLTRKRA